MQSKAIQHWNELALFGRGWQDAVADALDDLARVPLQPQLSQVQARLEGDFLPDVSLDYAHDAREDLVTGAKPYLGSLWVFGGMNSCHQVFEDHLC